jgi:hypothetical protein
MEALRGQESLSFLFSAEFSDSRKAPRWTGKMNNNCSNGNMTHLLKRVLSVVRTFFIFMCFLQNNRRHTKAVKVVYILSKYGRSFKNISEIFIVPPKTTSEKNMCQHKN